MSDFELGALLKLPRGTPNLAPLEFDLTKIEAVEKRKHEVAYANQETAPELMCVFNEAYCSVTRMMAQVSYEYSQAKKWADRRKSIVLLDVAPEVFKKKNLKSSEDLRKAVLDGDEEYLTLVDKQAMLEAAHAFLRTKSKGFEMSYQSAKKVFDRYNGSLGSHAFNLTMGVEQSPDEPEVIDGVIGNPRY
jgi:hypothetical protein